MGAASTCGVAGVSGVLVVAGADLDVAAASARAVATTGDSGWEGAVEFARAGADDIPFGIKVTSLALALMSTVESVAVAMSMRAFRHGIFFGYGTCFWRSSVPWMLYCHLTGITVRTAVMIGIIRESPEVFSLWAVGVWGTGVCGVSGRGTSFTAGAGSGVRAGGVTTGVPGTGSSGAETEAAGAAVVEGRPPMSLRIMLKAVPSEVLIWRYPVGVISPIISSRT